MKNTKAFLERLSKFYWSPNHPSTYVIEGSGIGNIAHHDYGAFNLIWLAYPLETIDDHRLAIAAFSIQTSMNEQLINDVSLRDILTLITPSDLHTLLENHGKDLMPSSRQNVEKAINRWYTAKTC